MIVKKKDIVVTNEWYNLSLFGDWHLGNMDTDEEKVSDVSDFLGKKKKNEYGVILLGDLVENVVPGSKGNPFELKIPDPSNQSSRAAGYIKKFKNLVLASVEGNHELRTRKRTGQFLNQAILEKVYGEDVAKNIYFGYNGMLILQFKNSKGKNLAKYRIFVTHGNGNATSVSGKLGKIYTLRDRADADIYVQGHLHLKLGMCDYIMKENVLRKRVFASCSSYLIEASYAQEAGYKPTDYGINKLSLNTKQSEIIGYY